MAKQTNSTNKSGVAGLSVELVYRVAGEEFTNPKDAEQFLARKAQEAEEGKTKKLVSSIMTRVRANRRAEVKPGVEYLVALLLRDAELAAVFQTGVQPDKKQATPKEAPKPKDAPKPKETAKPKDTPKPKETPAGKPKSKKTTRAEQQKPLNLDKLPPPPGGPPPPPPDIVQQSMSKS